jgi:hypothetical protein
VSETQSELFKSGNVIGITIIFSLKPKHRPFNYKNSLCLCWFSPLPIAASRTVKLGGTVATVGFPDIGLQGFAPKVLAHGHHGGNRVAGGRGG